MRFGVCYYPEQWPQERWPTDAAMMAEAGLELVRVAEFAWSSYEPERGRFEFGWLDQALDVLAAHDLGIVMCTPTATPPVWLVRERPEVLSVGPDGRRRAYGSRRHTCVTAPAYREEAARVVDVLLDRYADHPAIVGWQVDNEPGNHDSARCWCDACQAAFGTWLEDRFDTVDALNEAWGTAFWSMTYPDFAAVRLPVPTVTSHNPSLLLAHRQFASRQTLDFLRNQFQQIESRVTADVMLTTNFYGEDTAVDQRAASRLGGHAAVDSYPHGPRDPMITAYHLDLTHWAPGGDGGAWVMEQQPGPINWTPDNPPVPDGQVRVWTWQVALHGFDALLYFRWRPARGGQEMYHSGLLRHDGTPRAALAEVGDTIRELRGSGRVPPPAPSVALLQSYDDAWAIEVNPHRRGLTHRDLQLGAYVAARRLGLDVAIVDPEDDLTPYDWILAPALHVATEKRVAALVNAINRGSRLVIGPRSLVVDRHGKISDRPLPHGLTDLLGARVDEMLSQTEPLTVEPWGTPAGVWTDVLEVAGGEVVATYAGGTSLDGRPAIVRSGNLVYVGCSDAGTWTRFLAGVTDRVPRPDHQEVFERTGGVGARSWRATIDHRTLDVAITLR